MSIRLPCAPLGAILVFTACGGGGVEPNASGRQPISGSDGDVEWFVDRAEASGLDFVHFNGMSGQFYQPELTGPGVALFDYDNDGDLDVYLVQGAMLGTGTPLIAPPDGPLTDRLYRNDLEVDADGRRTLRLTDVTDASGIDAPGYGQGVASGDYDNDGWLDLFVANYLNFSLETAVPCRDSAGRTGDYCDPATYGGEPDRLYRNRGDGTFTDVTIAAGINRAFGPGLGIATADVNADGWIDIFVANDQSENQLWMNQGDGTFRNMALMAGVALSPAGDAKADMGVDFGDFDNDGDEDLFITELTGQGSTLYVNDGAGLFEERAARTGIRQPSLPYTGFGAAWFRHGG